LRCVSVILLFERLAIPADFRGTVQDYVVFSCFTLNDLSLTLPRASGAADHCSIVSRAAQAGQLI